MSEPVIPELPHYHAAMMELEPLINIPGQRTSHERRLEDALISQCMDRRAAESKVAELARRPNWTHQEDCIEWQKKVAEQEVTITKLEETVAVYRGQSRLVERISNELERQATTIERLQQELDQWKPGEIRNKNIEKQLKKFAINAAKADPHLITGYSDAEIAAYEDE